MRNYEFVYIISPEAEEEDLQGVTDRVSQMIADAGGEVLRLDSWGRRRLAYPIRGFREGHYMVAQIQLEGGAISELRARLALTEEVIRYLLVRTDELAPMEARTYEEPQPDQEEMEPEEEPVEELEEVEPGEEPMPEKEAEDSEQEELGG